MSSGFLAPKNTPVFTSLPSKAQAQYLSANKSGLSSESLLHRLKESQLAGLFSGNGGGPAPVSSSPDTLSLVSAKLDQISVGQVSSSEDQRELDMIRHQYSVAKAEHGAALAAIVEEAHLESVALDEERQALIKDIPQFYSRALSGSGSRFCTESDVVFLGHVSRIEHTLVKRDGATLTWVLRIDLKTGNSYLLNNHLTIKYRETYPNPRPLILEASEPRYQTGAVRLSVGSLADLGQSLDDSAASVLLTALYSESESEVCQAVTFIVRRLLPLCVEWFLDTVY
ncbi:hypothetical protein KIPB_006385 [Kipferlia bialata]|uniref:Uncharacterized protein n=1 Tax=Kipferlia bialata TaxID=797122 RepID=A0A9K3CXU0_9EUKA|nr:hypothetical protein KIPB_005090 [Kipferlia bialata]GIQ84380.1 hypothetical protein KIPB_005861 [Kipferlia bialata]GIQ84816.1 hypothetical protein KIPB_006385 [Kipferlia bialata]|eukprot:g5090.t1